MARRKLNDPDVLAKYQGMITRSMKWRHDDDRDIMWERMVDLYRGKQYKRTASEDRMLVNLAFATKNVIAPSVAINNPKFAINARKPDDAPKAVVAEQVLNYLWRVGKYQDDFRLAVDDFLVIGHGWCKVGYRAKKPIELKKLPDTADDSGDEDEGVDDRDGDVEGNVESEVRTLGGPEDRPFVERVSPKDILVDPDATHPRYMKWIAQRTKRMVADVMVDSRYDAKVRTKASGTKHIGMDEDESSRKDNDAADVPYVSVWEFYDIRKGTVCTFMDGNTEGFLIPPAPHPYPFGQPFVMLRNYEVPDTFYPMGELEAIEGLQLELNETRTQMMNHRKRYQRKILYDKDAFNEDGIKALQDDKDNVLVPVDTNDANVDILKVVAPMPQMGTPPDFYNQSELISNDIDRISGVSDYMRGASAEIRRTATEAAMIQDASNARAADKLGRIEAALSVLGGRVMELMQVYMTGETVVRIVGMNAAPVWVTIDSDYIQGDFDFEVEGGSTAPKNDSFRRQSALQLVDALAPFIGQGVVDPQAVARYVLQFGFDIKDPDRFMGGEQPGEQPDQQGVADEQDPTGGFDPNAQPQGPPPDSAVGGVPPEIMAQMQAQFGFSPQGQ